MGAGVTAIIQARMTSSRLPGKVLRRIQGKPVLAYQIERIKWCRRLSNVLVATSTNAADDPIEEMAKVHGLSVFRGSEHDVLDRFYQAAKAAHAGVIMRLTGDCPLIDPDVCDHVTDVFL